MASDRDSCITHMPDGRRFELCSEEGANAFLRYGTAGSFNWFTMNIPTCKMIRGSNRRLSAGDKERLLMIGFTADSFSGYCDQSVFAECVSDDEIVFWLDYVMDELKELARNTGWISNGTLERHDAFTINPCVTMFSHEAPARLAMERGFFKVFAEFIQARKAPLLPCKDIADTICLMVGNTFVSLAMKEGTSGPTFDNEVKKLMKEWESCGMLKEFIRCSTIPQDHDAFHFPPVIPKIYESLANNCTLLVRDKFKRGEPCGDVIHAIIHGKDGSKVKRKLVIQKLQGLASLADVFQPLESQVGHKDGNKVCRNCNKFSMSEEFQNNLMKCSRCKTVYYCSKECQKADWKAHKPQCTPLAKNERKEGEACSQAVMTWSQKNYFAIMERVVDVCRESNLAKNEVLLELDFLPDESGLAPALRQPSPAFHVKASRGYFEGDRPNEPDWFYKEDEEVYNRNVKKVISALQDNFNRITDIHLLCFVRHANGFTSCYRMQMQAGIDNDTQLFGNDAFGAFESAVHEKDFGALRALFGEEVTSRIMRHLAPNMPPSEADIDRVRALLNAMGGNF